MKTLRLIGPFSPQNTQQHTEVFDSPFPNYLGKRTSSTALDAVTVNVLVHTF